MLFEGPYETDFDVTADGTRFLNKYEAEQYFGPSQPWLVQERSPSWDAALRTPSMKRWR